LNKLWLPNHVYYEYRKHRKTKVTAPKFRYDQLLKKMNNNNDSGYIQKIEENLNAIKGVLKTLEDETKNAEKHPYIGKSIISNYAEKFSLINNEFIQFKEELTREIDDQKKKIEKKIENDKVYEFINKQFIIGNEYEFKKMVDIAKEGALRYSLEIPPGYMDAQGQNEKTGLQKFGDLFIWQQILDFALEHNKSIIFITNDVKEDWCITKENDKNYIEMPRVELLKEFKDQTKQNIWLYTTKQFLYKSNRYIKSGVSQEIIDEVGQFAVNYGQILEFQNVIGINRGDTIDKVYKLFGDPNVHTEHDETYTFNTIYYENKFDPFLRITYDKKSKKVYTITLSKSTKEFIEPKYIYDNKINYINMHLSEIQEIFGNTDEVYSGNYVYKYDRMQIAFQCYEFQKELCSEITIYWFN